MQLSDDWSMKLLWCGHMRSKKEVESELAYLRKALDNISSEKPQLKNLLSSEDTNYYVLEGCDALILPPLKHLYYW